MELLPYHRFGLNKYRQLDLFPPAAEVKEPEPEQIEKAQALLQSLGLRCTVEH